MRLRHSIEKLKTLAVPAVDNLLTMDEEQLFKELGRRLTIFASEPNSGGLFEMQASSRSFESDTDFGLVGKLYLNNLNDVAFKVICSTHEGGKIVNSILYQGESAVAATIAAVLVAQLGLAAPIAASVAALIVKLFFKDSTMELCFSWMEHPPKFDEPTGV
jgi:hypothetical protein